MKTKYIVKADFMATHPSLIKFLLKKDPFYVGVLHRARQFLSPDNEHFVRVRSCLFLEFARNVVEP